ncbi:MAG: hypothetical protein ACLFUF_06240 [Opitutales bacterium]
MNSKQSLFNKQRFLVFIAKLRMKSHKHCGNETSFSGFTELLTRALACRFAPNLSERAKRKVKDLEGFICWVLDSKTKNTTETYLHFI